MITGLCGNSFASLEMLLTLSQHETMLRKQPIRHFRNEKETGAKMCPAMVSGIATGDVTLVTVPEVIAKVNSAQFPLVFKVGVEHYFHRTQMLNFQNPYLAGTAQIALR